MSDVYLAILGDVVGSREAPDREQMQQRLRAALNTLNERFAEHLVARFDFTGGDAFEGLATVDIALPKLWWTYQHHTRPDIATRLAFGMGTLATRADRPVQELDGPCFHVTRRALEWARDNGRELAFAIENDAQAASALNNAAALLDWTTRKWTPAQWETVCLLAELGQKVAVAERRDVRKQSVDDVLRSAAGEEVLAGMDGLAHIYRSRSQAK